MQRVTQDECREQRCRDGRYDNGQRGYADLGYLGERQAESEQNHGGLQNLLRCEFDSRRSATFVFPEYADDHASENGEHCAADDRNGGSQKPADNGERGANCDARREGANGAHEVLSRLEDGRRSSTVMGD